MKLVGFATIISENTRVLILGSFPSVASLEKQQYYGHPQNQFWKLMGKIVNEDLYNASYEHKKKTVLQHNYGIWDVYQGCLRKGSLDMDIKKAKLNNFAHLKTKAPLLQKICANGKAAGKHAKTLETLGYKVTILPSSSPANTLPYTQKLKMWKDAVRID